MSSPVEPFNAFRPQPQMDKGSGSGSGSWKGGQWPERGSGSWQGSSWQQGGGWRGGHHESGDRRGKRTCYACGEEGHEGRMCEASAAVRLQWQEQLLQKARAAVEAEEEAKRREEEKEQAAEAANVGRDR